MPDHLSPPAIQELSGEIDFRKIRERRPEKLFFASTLDREECVIWLETYLAEEGFEVQYGAEKKVDPNRGNMPAVPYLIIGHPEGTGKMVESSVAEQSWASWQAIELPKELSAADEDDDEGEEEEESQQEIPPTRGGLGRAGHISPPSPVNASAPLNAVQLAAELWLMGDLENCITPEDVQSIGKVLVKRYGLRLAERAVHALEPKQIQAICSADNPPAYLASCLQNMANRLSS